MLKVACIPAHDTGVTRYAVLLWTWSLGKQCTDTSLFMRVLLGSLWMLLNMVDLGDQMCCFLDSLKEGIHAGGCNSFLHEKLHSMKCKCKIFQVENYTLQL